MLSAVLTVLLSLASPSVPQPMPLHIYWIDVEGGGATLIVTPAGESILIDAGWNLDRDAARIYDVATKVAGVHEIDYFIATHWHADHYGGAIKLSQRVPIKKFYANYLIPFYIMRRCLLCTDLTLEPMEILRLYGWRFKIEVSFKQAIHTVGAYAYHFWMRGMTPIHRGGGKQHVHRKSETYRQNIRRKIGTYERHIQLGLIAQGLMQCLALNFRRVTWFNFHTYIRTAAPAEAAFGMGRISGAAPYVASISAGFAPEPYPQEIPGVENQPAILRLFRPFQP